MLNKLRSEIRNEPIVLAHHPLCGRYDDHFFIIRGRKVCRGCLTVYPTAAVGVIALLLLNYSDFTGLFFLALALFIANLTRLVLNRSKASNLIFNVLLGLCLSVTIFSALNCPGDLVLLFYPFVIATYLVFMFYRGMRMYNGCKRCPDYGMFPTCFTREKIIRNIPSELNNNKQI